MTVLVEEVLQPQQVQVGEEGEEVGALAETGPPNGRARAP